MPNFKKPYDRSPRNDRRPDERRPGRPGDFRQKSFEKFDAICSKCGKSCQVPFRPNGVKPVFCSECFGAPHSSSGDRGNFAPRGSGGKSFESPRGGTKSLADLERQIGAMNTKIDKMLEILESIPIEEEADDEFEPPEPVMPAPREYPPTKTGSKKRTPRK